MMWCVGEVLLGLPQRLVEAAERRAAIAGDEAGGVEPGGEVALALQHGQADQRLDAGQEDAAGGGGVFVVQRRRERGRQSSGCSLSSPVVAPCGRRFDDAPPGVAGDACLVWLGVCARRSAFRQYLAGIEQVVAGRARA